MGNRAGGRRAQPYPIPPTTTFYPPGPNYPPGPGYPLGPGYSPRPGYSSGPGYPYGGQRPICPAHSPRHRRPGPYGAYPPMSPYL